MADDRDLIDPWQRRTEHLLAWALWSCGRSRWYHCYTTAWARGFSRWRYRHGLYWLRLPFGNARWWLQHPLRGLVVGALQVRGMLPRCSVCARPINTIWGHRDRAEDGRAAVGPWVCGVGCAEQRDTPINLRLRELEAEGTLVRVRRDA